MDHLMLFLTGAAGAAVIKLFDGIIQFKLQRKAKKEDAGEQRKTEVETQLAEVSTKVDRLQKSLDDHIRKDDDRDADKHRARILQFNRELLMDVRHTREEFIDILLDIDFYETYCRDHEDYKNNRAVHAIANIGRVYDERLIKHDFAKEPDAV